MQSLLESSAGSFTLEGLQRTRATAWEDGHVTRLAGEVDGGVFLFFFFSPHALLIRVTSDTWRRPLFWPAEAGFRGRTKNATSPFHYGRIRNRSGVGVVQNNH